VSPGSSLLWSLWPFFIFHQFLKAFEKQRFRRVSENGVKLALSLLLPFLMQKNLCGSEETI
jgi:hypothetical protein